MRAIQAISISIQFGSVPVHIGSVAAFPIHAEPILLLSPTFEGLLSCLGFPAFGLLVFVVATVRSVRLMSKSIRTVPLNRFRLSVPGLVRGFHALSES